MTNEEKLKDQAYQLRNRINQVSEINNDPNTIEEDSEDVDILNLPPRSQTHINKKTSVKWKISFPLIRFLFVLFILIVFMVLTYHIWGEELLPSSVSKESTSPNPAGEMVRIIDTDKKSPPVTEEQAIQINPQIGSDEVNQTSTEFIGTEETIQPEKTEVTYYQVKQGDTLFQIAISFYGSKEGEKVIIEANNLQDREVITGQEILIPNNELTLN
ncbi:LysM peptidoglycan-binding domain-containing protein [Aquibacillus saliphilus]|uniref:LysM peptidoglycan-binding domain-containing protein n=1 Tax=Aquibacillus saliphilus TaxID=1909422 RepID=UPI001CF02948